HSTEAVVDKVQLTEQEMLSKICNDAQITIDGQKRLFTLLTQYSNVYKGDKRGCVKGLTHAIQVSTSHPIVSRPRVHTEEHEHAIEVEVEKMLKDGVIVPSNSPHSSEIVMVKKKTGEWRMCIDYRQLNKNTINDQY